MADLTEPVALLREALNLYQGISAQDPAEGDWDSWASRAERWLRQLEELTNRG